MPEIVFELRLLNLRYQLRGFAAIKELKEWLDDNASEGYEMEPRDPPGVSVNEPEPTTP